MHTTATPTHDGARGRAALDHDFDLCFYEPAMPMWAGPPAPAEMVVCIDVLEHIEPDCLEAVLDDLKRVTASFGIFTVATGPAKKVLADGRNAHLIQQDPEWWMMKIFARFVVKTFIAEKGWLWVMVLPKLSTNGP